MKPLPKGIYYKVLAEGKADEKHPTPRSIVTAHYTGRTIDGKQFDSSDNVNVATVNSETGEVTIKGTGNATIKATVADGTNYTYATKTAQYTLTVEAATGISDVKTDATENANWYDLSGRPLNGKPTKAGVYVKNGKKVVIK